jgi:hypothetical protein
VKKEQESREDDSVVNEGKRDTVDGEHDLGQKDDLVTDEKNKLKLGPTHDDLQPSLQV